MDRVWRHAPAAALHIRQDAQGLQVVANEAAKRWAQGQGLAAGDWAALAAAWWPTSAPAFGLAALGTRELAVDVRRVALDDGGVLLWLQSQGADERLFAARRTTEMMDRALDLAGISLWRLDQRTQRFHFNAVGFALMDLPPDPAGVPVAALRNTLHPEDRPLVERAAEEAASGDRVIDVVARYRLRDGRWRTLLTRRTAERGPDGELLGLTGISMDVGPQMAERQHAQALSEHTRLVAETMGVGFWSRDIDAGQAHWDEQMYRIHSRPPEGGPPGFDDWILQHVHPVDQGRVMAVHQRASAAWEPEVTATFRLPGAPGHERWVQAWTRRLVRDGRRQAFGMHLDVTDRRQAQARLAHERDRMQYAADAVGLGVWERGLDGRGTFWSEGMYRLRGLMPDDPRPVEALAIACGHPEDLPRLQALVQQRLADGQPYRQEFRVRWPDGQVRWLATQGHAQRDAEGRLLGMTGVNIDITERKQADALRQQTERAEQTARDQSAFLARASHELRTPMNAVLGFAQLLADDPQAPVSPRQADRLQRILQAGQQMMVLVDGLLNLSDSLRAAPPVSASAPAPAPAPVSPALATVPPAAPVPTQPPAKQALDVLCVEDNPVNLLLVRELLAMRPGVRLREAVDGAQGIQLAQQQAPDLLLLDLQLPDMSGLAVLQALRGQPALRHCRFVALSADAMPENIAAALAAGFHHYWTKPIHFETFLAGLEGIAAEVAAWRAADI